MESNLNDKLEEQPIESLHVSNSNEVDNIDFNSNSSILFQIMKLSYTIIFAYCTYGILSTLTYYFISDYIIEYTEAKGILLLYYFTMICGLLWGSSIGYEIRASQAYGNKNIKEIKNQTSVIFNMFIYLTLFIYVITYFFTKLLSILHINAISLENIYSELPLLMLSVPLLCVCTVFLRLANSIQKPEILNLYSICFDKKV